jgi:hypothetical protein
MARRSRSSVGAVDTLIGDIVRPEALMKTLADRKIADQQAVTCQTQMKAQDMRKDLENATALANMQDEVVQSDRKVAIAEFTANATVKASGVARRECPAKFKIEI